MKILGTAWSGGRGKRETVGRQGDPLTYLTTRCKVMSVGSDGEAVDEHCGTVLRSELPHCGGRLHAHLRPLHSGRRHLQPDRRGDTPGSGCGH